MMDMYRKGVSISEIARQTGHDRKTIRKAVNKGSQPGRKKRQRAVKRERKLSPFERYLKERMADGVYNSRKLYRELRERGYTGGLTQVILYLQPYRPKRDEPAVMRFETAPGQQAQVDWGYFGTMEHEGRQRKLYVFVMTLCWSRAMYVEFTVNGNTDWFIRCHQHAFEYFGGVTHEVLHDNLKSAVISRGGSCGMSAIWILRRTAALLPMRASRIGRRPRARWSAGLGMCARTSGVGCILPTWMI